MKNYPPEVLDVYGNINTTGVYKVSDTQFLSGTTIGGGVVNSSLNKVTWVFVVVNSSATFPKSPISDHLFSIFFASVPVVSDIAFRINLDATPTSL